MAKGEQNQGFKSLSSMLIFIIIAALLWLIIKLSDTYTITLPFAINYVEIPADQLITDEDYEIEATVTTTGFKLLNYYFVPRHSRKIDISLKETKYKLTENDTYSYSSRYVEEEIAKFISASSTDIQLKDDVQYFQMSKLASKRVKIVPEANLSFEKQYNYYGNPVSEPDSITIYGSFANISKITEIKTKPINLKNVNQNIVAKAKLDIGEGYYADIDEVNIYINVEKYTEAEVVIPITTPDSVNLHLYPNKVSIRYIVAMKDYSIINSMSFKATVEEKDLYINEVLPVNLVLYPNNTQIIGIEPKEVEYIVVQQ